MQRIKNLTNSPHDVLNAKGKKVRLPARGEIDVDIHPLHLPLYRALGYFEITEGKAAKAATVQPVGGAGAGDDDLAKLRADYQEVVGKRAYHGWDAEELQKRIDAALEA
ncbi:hypothetical protein JYP52_19785 [Nitratireductor aquibiodomus]|uniref:hypothetical protein n=1 Tax=Nitratireductor aquibiodomus TaxID=204799 RepID=UPI0019D3F892|nr:hypothetical protein [Nitratireductor aquibiodomus]MBN7763389.1 hypothetical protein [Nitratireductor aquibiodomus]